MKSELKFVDLLHQKFELVSRLLYWLMTLKNPRKLRLQYINAVNGPFITSQKAVMAAFVEKLT